MIENVSDEELESFFKGILVSSISYMVMKRCGIDPRDYFSAGDFDLIEVFASKRIISRLGAATRDIAEQELREIYSSIRNFEKSTNYINRTFAGNEKINYYKDEESDKRTDETRESDGMGTSNELYKKSSRGNGNKRDDLQLDLFSDIHNSSANELPTVEEQINNNA